MRSTLGRPAVLALAVVALAACAPTLKQQPVDTALAKQEAAKQRELALDLSTKRTDRLLDVSYRLRAAATDLCSDHVMVIGVALHDISAYSKEYQDAAVALFGVGHAVQVRYAQTGLPAAEAGIAAGDTILAVDGREVRKTADAIKALEKAAGKGDSATLTVACAAGRRDARVSFLPIVRYPVLLATDDIVNAYADGDNVYIASGMLRFAESDEELALVVGHEIAHNCLGHISKKKGNWLLGTLVDAFVYAGTGVDTSNLFGKAAAQSFSQGFESEADYMGLYLVRRAGYDVAAAPQFWRRMAAEHPGNIKQNFSASHPGTPERFLALENAVTEIQGKEATGEPLVPERR